MELKKYVLILLLTIYSIKIVESQTVSTTEWPVTPSTVYPRGPTPDTAGIEFHYSFTATAHRVQPTTFFDVVAQDPATTKELLIQVNSVHEGKTMKFRFAGGKARVNISNSEDFPVWQYLNNGLSKQINTAYIITFVVPVRLYAVNQDPITGQLDVTTVLPITMGGTNFIVTLPVASPRIYNTNQYQLLLFIPTSRDNYNDNIITVQMENSKVKEPLMTKTYNGTNYLYYMGWTRAVSSLQQTFYVTSTKPILVVATVTCAPVFTGIPGSCDYASYMPPPTYFEGCGQGIYAYDLVAADTTDAVNYFLSPPYWKDCNNSTTGVNSQYTYYQNAEEHTNIINSVGPQGPLRMNPNSTVAFRSDVALIQVTRFGGADISGHGNGAFLTHVPSMGSLITGIQYFMTLLPDTHVEVISDSPGPVIVDNVNCSSRSSMQNPLGQWYYYQCNANNNVNIIHSVYSPGKFAATVIGYGPSGSYVSYGFENSSGRVERRCDSIDLRNKPHEAFKHEGSQSNWRIYKNCTILDGDFTMSMMLSENNTDEQFPVFENLREITGSVLIFGVRGLTTLGRIFPSLRIIGGQSLIMNYALVIYQNQDLKTIGLDKLTVIRNGGVRVKDNFELCYAETINWDSILVGKLRDVIVENGGTTRNSMDIVRNNCNEYDGCKVDSSEKCQKIGNQLACWNSTTCQNYCKYHKLSDDTVGPGCSPSGERCHSECIGGCEFTDDPGTCHGCRNFEVNGTCVNKCPLGTYELLDWRCITQEECNSRRPISSSTDIQDKMIWKAFAGKCHYDCPKGYEEDDKDKTTCKRCESYCPKKCAGGIIHSIGDALKYSKCNIIEGNLEINVKIGTEIIPAEKFTEAFGEIEEIMGFLLIQMSHPFTNLHMFRSLKKIHGNELVNKKYALVVEENPNLRELFNVEEQPLKILNGSVSFQENKMLCMEKIEEFLRHIRTDPTKADISRFSNGEKAVCNEVPINVTLVKVGPNTIHLKWSKFNTSNMDQRKFLGYQVFFKKVDYMNQKVSIDEDRSACADSWSMEFFNSSVDVEEKGTVISVDPNTIYAYYVQTRLVNHPGARSGISPIQFVKTHFHYPDPPTIKKAIVLDADMIALELEPPREPRGNVTHYQISWLINEDRKHLAFQDPCTDLPHQIRQAQLALEKEKREKNQGTCSKIKGCCKCKEVETPDSEDSETKTFEEVVNKKINKPEEIPDSLVSVSRRKKRESENFDEDSFVNMTEFTVVNITDLNITAVNVSNTKIILSGLKHFTEYKIQILSCQDITAIENWCSKTSKERILRTKPLPDNDIVEYGSIKIGMVESTNETNKRIDGRRISWAPPGHPNSIVIAFKVKVYKDDGDTPLEQCVRYDDYIANGKGVIFNGLTDGAYFFEVRSLTFNGLSKSTIPKEFNVHIPGWFTWDRILYIILGLIIIIIGIWILGRKYYKRNFGKKVQEYLRQTISANPEYLSQVDVYKIDEWELKREDLALKDEVGRGTFGKVFKGYGKNITSVCGIKFGECAIKTVPESASHAERIHFLLEASVMKQFDTSFIVKLLGVVSDGQPVLVVMELMQNGNLRDFLRSRRPDAEENTNNAPLPTMFSYFKWAIQIADGMAYLESLKFCHRDLAARNCMVSSDETVKIGDFGMARDIYYHEYYRPAGKRLMPVRWMAPESLKDGIFTVKSDVWSYGIVLYEMLTLGEQPYAGLGNDQVFNYIGLKRSILLRPHMCPDFWYDLMRVCWKYDPRDRPWFYQIMMYMKNSVERTHLKDGMTTMLEKQCFVTTHFDQIDDEEYDFTYNEEAEKAKKHHILRELEKLAAQNSADYEYHKKGYGDSESLKNRKDSIDSTKFNMLTIEDMNDKLKPPEILTRKQIQEREKEREKFKKKKNEESHVPVTVPSRKSRGSRRMPPSEARSDVEQMKESKQVTELLRDGIREDI